MSVKPSPARESPTFLYLSRDIAFQELEAGRGALVSGTFMELDRISRNGRWYRLAEGESIAESLIGKSVFFGTKIECDAGVCKRKHDLSEKIGFVETAKKIGNLIKGTIKITSRKIINKLRAGEKFWFSVGGVADYVKKIAGGIRKLYGAMCTHLQLIGDKVVGFPSAKVEKVFFEVYEPVSLGYFIPKELIAYIVRRRRNE